MPINRAPFNALVDDSGNGLTGSIWNKAAIQSVLLDPMDAAYPSPYAVGSWTMTDGSGAGLTIGNAASGSYIKIGRFVFVTCQPVYPSTANTANAIIGGLPFASGGANPVGGCYLAYGPGPKMGFVSPGQSQIVLYNDATGANLRNVDVSGQNFVLVGHYQTPS